MNMLEILKQVQAGSISPAEAAPLINAEGESNIGFARVDLHRLRRCGLPEALYCPGKTPEQISAIIRALNDAGQNALATRITPEQATAVLREHPSAKYHPEARLLVLQKTPQPPGCGKIGVVCAGTTDIPIAEEAAITAEQMGAAVERIYDVGVAGLHRLLRHIDSLRSCRVLVVAAGMEGALPSVVGGMVSCPIVAVPTSVGYGANFNGLTALLAMLNTCVPGITVVNIDNGFGAGIAAALINRAGEPHP